MVEGGVGFLQDRLRIRLDSRLFLVVLTQPLTPAGGWVGALSDSIADQVVQFRVIVLRHKALTLGLSE